MTSNGLVTEDLIVYRWYELSTLTCILDPYFAHRFLAENLQQVLAIVFCQLSTKIVMSQGYISRIMVKVIAIKGYWEWRTNSGWLVTFCISSRVPVLRTRDKLCVRQLHPDLMAQQLTPEVAINMDLDVSFWSLLNLYFFQLGSNLFSVINFSLAGKMGLIWVFSEWLDLVDRLSLTSRAPFDR